MIETTFIQNLSYFENKGLFSTQTQMLMYLKQKQRMRLLLVFAYGIDALCHNHISTIIFDKQITTRKNVLTKTVVNLVE